MTLKVMTVAGTRPELIRLSLLISRLDNSTQHFFAYTGQNDSPFLSDLFFKDLRIRQPDTFFNVSTSSFAETIGETIIRAAEIMDRIQPDAVVVLGDTNSAMAAIPAERMGIPVFHLEAGNRSFDLNVPEELNRKLVDHIATFNIAYTETARRNLLSEGLNPRFTFVSGSPMKEILNKFSADISSSTVLERLELTSGQYILASLHRQENVDFASRLEASLRQLSNVGQSLDVPIIFSTHPRTQKRLDELGWTDPSSLKFVEPLGYFDYLRLQGESMCVVSDSGSVSEEAAIAGFPAVLMRDATERPEALEQGNIVLSGIGSNSLLDDVCYAVASREETVPPQGYEVENFSKRVESLILSTARLSHGWKNLLID